MPQTPNGANILRVAIIQDPPVFLNLAASVEKAQRLIEGAAASGARLVAFPETWLPGYPAWLDEAPGAALWDHAPAKALYQLLVENSLVLPSREADALAAAAQRAGVWVVMGAHLRRGGTLYNAMLFFAPDGTPPRLHLKLTPTYTERLIWGLGDGSTLAVVDTDFGRLGGLICWEHWVPLARAAMHARGEVVHVAQWPSVRELHQIASRHYAFEGQCFVLAAGTLLRKGDVINGFRSLGREAMGEELLQAITGDESRVIYSGGSAVIAPDISFVAGPLFDAAGTLTADIDLDAVTRGHLLMDSDGHYSRPDVFRLEVNDRPLRNVSFAASEQGCDTGDVKRCR